ncbi:hypothetical protein P7L78_09715 [Tistrella bauzanensis]|uniref:Uncharacterized protein n=1 Tax=Tistrella arctica TaxID=3133430 RepID=A0ABU9YSS2_9PROT
MSKPVVPAAPDGDDPADLSSAPCQMREADDVYMGYAPRDEIVAALNDLLSAVGPDIGRDDDAWAARTLRRHIVALGGAPSAAATGAGRHMLHRRLTALLPRIRDDRLHADLTLILPRLALTEDQR